MFPARVFKVLSDGPTTAADDGAVTVELRICLSDRSVRYCFATPDVCGMETVAEISS